jgi:flagellar basal-body rod protein FlgC
MIAIFDIALSGARAAVRRLEVSATNVAHVQAGAPVSADGQPGPTLYRPQQVQQTSAAQGGVSTTVSRIEPAYTLVPAAEAGLEALPNVNLVHESIEQSLALRSYQANLRVLKAADESQKALLDATA